MEFEVKGSPKILFNYIADPSGLSEWFADDVTVLENVFTFKWSDTKSQAKMETIKDLTCVRFKWLDSEKDTYFEFEIVTDDLTSDVALMVTDFALEEDIETEKQLWDSQVQQLRHIIGS